MPDDEEVKPAEPENEGVVIEVEAAGKPGKPELSDEEVEKLDQAPPDDEVARYAKDAQKRIKSLHIANQEWRRRVVQSNRDVATATNLAEQLYRENQQLKASTARSEQALIDQALQRSEAQMAQAKQRFLTARAAGDANSELGAQEEIARAAAESDRLKLLRTAPAAQGESVAPPAQPPQQPPQQPQPPTEGTQQWMRQNPWFGRDGEEEMTQFALGVDRALAKQGITEASSPKEYWGGIDRRLREKFPEKFQVKQEKESGRPVNVAGATRTNGEAAKPRSPRHVTLTESQVRLARSLGLTNEQYAAQLVRDENLQENSYHDIAIKR